MRFIIQKTGKTFHVGPGEIAIGGYLHDDVVGEFFFCGNNILILLRTLWLIIIKRRIAVIGQLLLLGRSVTHTSPSIRSFEPHATSLQIKKTPHCGACVCLCGYCEAYTNCIFT